MIVDSGDLPLAVDTGVLAPVRAGAAIEPVVGDRAWAQAVLDCLAALARARARLGAVPEQAAAVITRSARAEFFHPRLVVSAARDATDPVAALAAPLGRLVAELDPPSAEYVQHARAGQDILDTAAMTVAHRALTVIENRLGDAAGPPAARSGRGVPGWRGSLRDARSRLCRVRDEGLPVVLDGGPGPGDQPWEGQVDRLVDAFAGETGLNRPATARHARRTAVADLASALVFTAGVLGRAATGVRPAAREPVLAALVRAATVQVPPLAAGLSRASLSEDERSAGGWRAEWLLLRECLRLTGTAAETAVGLLRAAEVARP